VSISAAQVVPTILPELLRDYESPTAHRAMEALLRMKKEDRHPQARAGGCQRQSHGLEGVSREASASRYGFSHQNAVDFDDRDGWNACDANADR
jgi:hypothetical protein